MNSTLPFRLVLPFAALALTALTACADGDAKEKNVEAKAPAATRTTTPPATTPTTQAAAATPSGSTEDVMLDTTAGQIVIDLFEDKAPRHAENFKKLVRDGYYVNSPFHRVIDGFMAQGGGQWDATGGVTDAGYTVPAEIVPGVTHVRGSVAAARKPDQANPERASSGSQFYITYGPTAHLDGGYTVFGQVVSGLETVDTIVKGDPRSGLTNKDTATTIRSATLVPHVAR